MDLVEPLRKGEDEVGADESELGVPAIHRVAGKRRVIAKVLHPVPAEPAVAIGAAYPGDADAGARRRRIGGAFHEFADDLVAENEVGAKRGEVASTMWRSVRQTPQAMTRSRTWPG